jgi:hypothetical protein
MASNQIASKSFPFCTHWTAWYILRNRFKCVTCTAIYLSSVLLIMDQMALNDLWFWSSEKRSHSDKVVGKVREQALEGLWTKVVVPDLLSHSGSILSLPNTSGAAVRASPFPVTVFRFNSVFSSIRLFVITTCCCNQLFARETALYVCSVYRPISVFINNPYLCAF